MLQKYLFLLLFFNCGHSDAQHSTPQDSTSQNFGNTNRPIPTKLIGLTIDNIIPINEIETSLKKMSKKPITRIVFDGFMPATYYQQATERIFEHSLIMGELLDSYVMSKYSVSDYEKRAHEYLNLLKNKVDIWEIGNEINGEWLGKNEDIVKKMTVAFDIANKNMATTALTLYYNDNCWKYPQNEMFTWAKNNIPQKMKDQLDYVFISYYEEDCNNLKPNWNLVFSRLAKMFPNAKIGFGEAGIKDESKKSTYMKDYYSKKINEKNFVGGYFWWYGTQDLVPHTKPLWKTFNEILKEN